MLVSILFRWQGVLQCLDTVCALIFLIFLISNIPAAQIEKGGIDSRRVRVRLDRSALVGDLGGRAQRSPPRRHRLVVVLCTRSLQRAGRDRMCRRGPIEFQQRQPRRRNQWCGDRRVSIGARQSAAGRTDRGEWRDRVAAAVRIVCTICSTPWLIDATNLGNEGLLLCHWVYISPRNFLLNNFNNFRK